MYPNLCPDTAMQCNWTLITLVVIFLIVNVSGFRITFNPNEKLTELSSRIDKSFFNLLKFSFKHEAFWPILIALRQAHYYNFSHTFAVSLGILQCNRILEIIGKENFPVKEIFDAELLNHEGLGLCFSHFPVEFFRDRLQIYPIESGRYKASYWGLEKTFKFLKLSLDQTKLTTNWYSWVIDSQVFMKDPNDEAPVIPRDSWEWIWKILCFYSVNMLPEHVNYGLIEAISSECDSELNHFYRNHQNINLKLSGILNWSNIIFNEEEVDFSRNQIMKIVTMSIFAIVYQNGHINQIRSRSFLLNHLTLITNGRRKFPLRKELKKFIKNILALPEKREHAKSMQSYLILFAEHLKGFALGPWLLNIILIWNYFNEQSYSSINEFIRPFTKIFFAPESRATAPDVCLLLKSTNSFLGGGDDFISNWIIEEHFSKRLSLAKAVFKDCPAEIPKQKRRNSKFFPLSFRIEDLYMNSRFVPKFSPMPMSIVVQKPAEQVCLSIFKEVNARLDFTVVIPMNTKIMTNRMVFEGNLPGILNLFFQNLMFSTRWFVSDFYELRPVLRPTLIFPPQLMEYLGILLGQAIVSNVKVPFLLDRRYFSLPDAFDTLNEPLLPISALIHEIYPDIANEATSKDLQIHRIIASLNHSSAYVLDKLSKHFRFNGNVELGPASTETIEEISNSLYDLNRIVLMGAERLRSGLNLAVPADSFKSRELHKIIFK